MVCSCEIYSHLQCPGFSERAIARWQAKGLDVAEMQRKRAEREAARVRTVRSYVEEAREGWKHTLEVGVV